MNNAFPTIKDFENNDLIYISYDKNIPSAFKGSHLNLTLDELGRIKVNFVENKIPDPSTIYINLPIKEVQYDHVDKLSYWPHYIELSPEQRYVYLNWLRNVDTPVDMGYVFLYYYGLERQLLIGNFEKAFNQIIRLRNIHKNKSFQKYSENALVHSCIMADRLDLLLDLHEKTEISGFSNAQFLLAYNLKMTLSAKNLLQIFYKAFNLSRKAIKDNSALLEECTSEILLSKNEIGGFPIVNYDISKTKTVIENRFANYSFPKEIQNVEITDFYKCKLLMADIESIFNLSYERYKEKVAFERKKQSSNKSDEEIRQAQIKRNLNRYKKLLAERKITHEEFDVLSNWANVNTKFLNQ